MVQITHNFREVEQKLRRAGATTIKNADQALHRGALEIQRDARTGAPKFHSILTNSISITRRALLDYEISTGTEYAAAQEKGTRPGYWPNMRPGSDFYKWVQAITGASGDETDRLAFLIGRAISSKGTQATNYMETAANSNIDRVFSRLSVAIEEGLASES